MLNLRELFDEIDINGDQLMEWTEFTAFISEKAGLTNAIGLDAITEYRDIVRDPSVRRVKKRAKPFQDCYYVQPLDAVACIDGNVPVVFMYSAENGNPIAELKSTDVTGMPTAMEYIGNQSCVGSIPPADWPWHVRTVPLYRGRWTTKVKSTNSLGYIQRGPLHTHKCV